MYSDLFQVLGAYPDDSDKVENGKSLKKYKERVAYGYVIGDGSSGETELNCRFWSGWIVMMHMLCLVWNINIRDNSLGQSM